MVPFKPYTINVNGRLMMLDAPKVMGILNLTPDSFYPDSRKQTGEECLKQAEYPPTVFFCCVRTAFTESWIRETEEKGKQAGMLRRGMLRKRILWERY